MFVMSVISSEALKTIGAAKVKAPHSKTLRLEIMGKFILCIGTSPVLSG
jgi:hypothetical protein